MESSADIVVPMLDQAIRHHRAGRLGEAEALYRRVLEAQPDNALALYRVGLLANQAGRHEEAVQQIGRAVRLDQNNPIAFYNLAVSYQALGRLDDAIAAYQRALALRPAFAEALNNLGSSYSAKGDLPRAIDAYRRAIDVRPDYADAYNNLGIALHQNRELDAAVAALRQAIALRPQSAAAAHNNLGNALQQKGDFQAAADSFRAALAIDGAYTQAWSNLGTALIRLGEFEQAADACLRALALRPEYAPAWNNLGIALKEEGNLRESITAIEQAIAVGARDAETFNNLGNAFKAGNQLEKAIEAYRQSIAVRADYAEAHFGLGWTLLLQGNFTQGWAEYEWRQQFDEFIARSRQFRQPLWDGSDLNGCSILLQAEGGFGDVLQFARYAPLVSERGGRVILRCQPELRRLLKTLAGVEQIVGDSVPPTDVRCPLLSLPRIFATTLHNVPATIPYLHAEPATMEQWRQRLGGADGAGRRRVGLVWAGSPSNQNDRHRSIALSRFAPLAGSSGVQFYSLQKGPPAAQAQDPPPGMDLVDLGPELNDFADTAALLANLDLLITVDTSAAHLAGALGRPAWVLLPFAPDFRWMLGRDDSPWYPTLRLIRQLSFGDWDSVIERIADELAKL